MTDEKELKDQRIPIMMSPSEVEAIDDWMFKNRIRSRGEAIRRLCKVGIGADAEFNRLTERIFDLSNLAVSNDIEQKTEQSHSISRAVFDVLQSYGIIRSSIVTMRDKKPTDEVFSDLAELMQAWANQDPERFETLRSFMVDVDNKDKRQPD